MRTSPFASVLVVSMLASATQAAVLKSTFDADLEGWQITNTFGAQWQNAGGNPGGFAYIDNTEQQIAYMFAPAAFLGDLSAYNGHSFSFDAIQIQGGGSPWDNFENFGRLRLTGMSGTVTADLVPGTTGPGRVWTTYSVPFTGAAFGVSEGEWATLLSSVSEISLNVEGLFGPEINGVDNITLVPGTATIAPFAIMAVASLRRRGSRRTA